MERWLVIALAGSGLAGCGSGADPSGFPTAYAHALCHFQYHCCTPAERTFAAAFRGIGPDYTFARVAEALGYADEGGCNDKLSLYFRTDGQPVQTSVKDKRIIWSTTAAQACLDTLTTAGSKCDPQGFAVALNGDPSQPGTPAVCDASQWLTGTLAAGAACTIPEDCAGLDSSCDPAMPGSTPVIQVGGNCAPLPVRGQACGQAGCVPTDSCCFNQTQICAGFQSQGAACSPPDSFNCSSLPCDPRIGFCGWTGNGYTCQALQPAMAPCGKDDSGITLSYSCLSGSCTNGLCDPAPASATYAICTGNPDGL
jgi:hypothetical protein